MAGCPEVEPHEVLEDRRLRLVDIRPLDERLALATLIPGSRAISPEHLFDPGGLVDYPASCRICVVCLSGHRSCHLAREIRNHGYLSVFSLKGGILGWEAAGLPTVQEVPTANQQINDERFYHSVRACFVSEAVENALDRDFSPEFDPLKLLDDLRLRLGFEVGKLTSHQACDYLDALGELARTLGHDMDRIAYNLTRLRSVVVQLESEERADAE